VTIGHSKNSDALRGLGILLEAKNGRMAFTKFPPSPQSAHARLLTQRGDDDLITETNRAGLRTFLHARSNTGFKQRLRLFFCDSHELASELARGHLSELIAPGKSWSME
jgi:hypothetical protein